MLFPAVALQKLPHSPKCPHSNVGSGVRAKPKRSRARGATEGERFSRRLKEGGGRRQKKARGGRRGSRTLGGDGELGVDARLEPPVSPSGAERASTDSWRPRGG